MSAPVELTREQILAFRRRVSALEERLPMSAKSLQLAAWAGLQDSMPRAALLSIHARVSETPADVLDNPALVQVWGPRYSAYAIAAVDLPIFTLSRMPDDAKGQRRAESTADLLEKALNGQRMKDRDAHKLLAGHPYSMRYATATGRVLIRWEGALAPWVWTVPRPQMSVADARREMARRYLRVFGPTTALKFAEWAGISAPAGAAAFEGLSSELVAVSGPVGDGWLLAADEQLMRDKQDTEPRATRLLPSGDTYTLLWGRDRELLVPNAARRLDLWTTRVWPGALLVGGEIVGVWRRSNEKVQIDAWRQLTAAEKETIYNEAKSMPLPGLKRPISVRFGQAA
ncbi:MAG TPA: crosslink repair DNA glycosylase YcaQ family protein [Candidatus Limnocylindrales bacterium]